MCAHALLGAINYFINIKRIIMSKDSSRKVKCFLIAVLSFLPFNGIAQMPRFFNANKTPELKLYDYSAEYDGLKGPVKEVITFEGSINSVFGNKTLVKERSIGHNKYLSDGLRMEAYEGDGYDTGYGIKYYFNNSKIDSIYIYDYHKYEGYGEKPNAKITFEYVAPDCTIERYYEFKEISYGKKDWEQTEQLNIKELSGGFECIYFPSITDEGVNSLYINQDLKFNCRDKVNYSSGNPEFLFKNSIFRLDKLSLIKEAVRFTDDGAGEIKTDDLGRIIRIRPSQKKLNQLLSDGNNSYKATHLEYDENGNISKIVYSEYFTNGTRQNRNWKHIEDDVIKVDYTYDSYSNWTMAKITTFHQSWEKYLSSYGKETNKEESYYIREISYYSDNDKTLPTSLFVNEEKIDDGIGQTIYDNVEQCPTYPQGEYRLANDIIDGLPDKYKSEREGKYPAQIIVKFAVYKSGKIDNLEIIKGGENLSEDVSNEIMAAFKQLDSFTPGKNNGQPVNSWFSFPVQCYLSFSQLNEDAKREAELKRERDAQEEAKRICTFAYNAIKQCILMQEYDKSKGMAAGGSFPNFGSLKSNDYTIPANIKHGQITKFEVKGDLYSFIKKDKTVIQDIHFDRMVSDLDYSHHDFGFLSDDKRFALVINHNDYTEDFIYIVEFEGNEVKSISSIPYKKSKDFVLPQL